LGLSAVALFAHPSAKEIYNKSAKVLSFEKIKFQVTSKMKSGTYIEEQHFSLAREGNEKRSTALICFLSPKNIKGTAMLLKKDAMQSSTLVYFPSIGRTRIIPKENENDEALGLGLSFSELQNNAQNLKFIAETTKNGKTFYKIEKNLDKERTLYLIEKDTMILTNMQIFEKDKLIKEVRIKNSTIYKGKILITEWEILNYKKNKQTYYRVDTKSITTTFNNRIFKKSALSHCRP
jgi:hypothetical protein